MSIKTIIPKANWHARRMLLDAIRALPDRDYRVEIVQLRPRRSGQQNRFYWPCYVQPFGDWLRGHGNTHFTDEMAHEVLKRMFLETSIVDETTGQVFSYVRSTTELTTAEFGEYLEKIAAFLATECGITVEEAR